MVAFSQQVLKIDSSRLWAPTRPPNAFYNLQLSPGLLSNAFGGRQTGDTRKGGEPWGTVLGFGTTTPGRHEMRNNTVRRHSHENLFHCRATLGVWAALIVPLFATIAAQPAGAQITAPTGTTVAVPAGTTITCIDCVALSVPGPASWHDHHSRTFYA